MDCDPGIDDSLAILLALASGELSVRAITTTFGNAGLSQTTRNALSVLELSGVKEPPPVGAGSGGPLKAPPPKAARGVHGMDGLGNRGLPPPGLKPQTHDGIGLMISKVCSGEAEAVIATGPLTNVARALLRDAEFSKRLKCLYIMGGAVFVGGNVTPYAEFNFHSDPDAADLVLRSGVPITLVSLDVTHKVNVTQEHVDRLRGRNNSLSDFVAGIIEYSISCHKRDRGAEGAHLHDPVAVALAVAPQLGEYEGVSLGVDCGKKRGMAQVIDGVKNVRFAKDIDVEGFINLFLNRIGGALEAI